MNIKVLGGGCANCMKLEKNVKKALAKLGQEYELEKITDYQKIAQYGIISTPGLIVDEKIVSYGKVLSPDDLVKLLRV